MIANLVYHTDSPYVLRPTPAFPYKRCFYVCLPIISILCSPIQASYELCALTSWYRCQYCSSPGIVEFRHAPTGLTIGCRVARVSIRSSRDICSLAGCPCAHQSVTTHWNLSVCGWVMQSYAMLMSSHTAMGRRTNKQEIMYASCACTTTHSLNAEQWEYIRPYLCLSHAVVQLYLFTY